MKDDSTIIAFQQTGLMTDPLTEIAREGARRVLAAALKAEADSFVAQFGAELLADGHQRLVWHGAGSERVTQTGIGPITCLQLDVSLAARFVPPRKDQKWAEWSDRGTARD